MSSLEKIRQSIMRWGMDTQARLLAETADFAQKQHLGWPYAPLSDIFVQPRLLLPPPADDPYQPPNWNIRQLIYFWPSLATKVAAPIMPTVSLDDMLKNGRYVVISAPSGAGKSALLSYTAYRCATAETDEQVHGYHNKLPLQVHLSELNLNHHPLKALSQLLARRFDKLNQRGLNELITNRLEQGTAVLLLDGWDDLTQEQADEAAHWVHGLMKQYPGLQIIVAAAESGYGGLLELGFTLTTLLPWREGQVEQLGQQWQLGKRAEILPAERYWEPSQTAMMTTLRLLTTPAHVRATALNEIKIFENGLNLFLSRLQDDHALVLHFWTLLATTMLVERRATMPQDEVRELAKQAAAQHDVTHRQPINGLVETVQRVALFTGWESNSLRFTSRAWRDYLAATRFARKQQHQLVLSHLYDVRWRQVIRFYVAQAGATRLAPRLLERQEQRHDVLFQLADWMPNTPDQGAWRQEVLRELSKLARDSKQPHILRQRALAAMAQSREQGVFLFLVQQLRRSDPFLRQAAAVALPSLYATHGEEVIEILSSLLRDRSLSVEQTAVYALTWLASRKAESALIKAFLTGDLRLQQAVIAGMAHNGRYWQEIIAEALSDDQPDVRRSAVLGLRQANLPWVKPLLQELYRQENEWLVQSAITETLTTFRQQERASYWQSAEEPRWLVDEAAKFGKALRSSDNHRFLIELLEQSPQPLIRSAAASSLARFAPQEALPALKTAVRDAHKQVREAAYITLCLVQRAHPSIPL